MPVNPDDLSPLSVLGFSAEQDATYRVLLRNSGASLDALAALVPVSADQLREDVARFVASGLVELRGDTVVALAPDQALARLITEEGRRLQSVAEQLESLRGLLPSLTAEHLASQAPRGVEVPLELVEGGDVADLIRGICAASTGDLLWLRPDQWRLAPGYDIDETVKELVRSGRRSRAIYPARVLEEAPEVVRARAEAGEHVRILAEVPTRIAIMGTTAALVPERFGVNTGRRLIVRQPAMVTALTMLFDSMWVRAMAIPGMDDQRHDDERVGDRRLLLDQLAGGAKDEQIARALGLSLRTVRRRVAGILEELGADSRFQAGVEACRRGWL
jgi:hypothetical protein